MGRRGRLHPIFANLDKLATFLGFEVHGDTATRTYVSSSAPVAATTASSIDILGAAKRHHVAVAEARATAISSIRSRVESAVANLPLRPAPVIPCAPSITPEIPPEPLRSVSTTAPVQRVTSTTGSRPMTAPATPTFPATTRAAFTLIGRLIWGHGWRIPLASALGIDRRMLTRLLADDAPLSPQLLDRLRAALHRHAVDCVRVREAIPVSQFDFVEVCDDAGVLREVVREAKGEGSGEKADGGADIVELASRRRVAG
jgi:hypothetical protein